MLCAPATCPPPPSSARAWGRWAPPQTQGSWRAAAAGLHSSAGGAQRVVPHPASDHDSHNKRSGAALSTPCPCLSHRAGHRSARREPHPSMQGRRALPPPHLGRSLALVLYQTAPLTVGHVAVAGDPAAVGGAPEHVPRVHGKHILRGLAHKHHEAACKVPGEQH